MKNAIRFSSTQKPDGKEYKKITYWNRFIRMKAETLVLLALVTISISAGAYRLNTGTMDTFWAIICIAFLAYPWMVIVQFNASISYHLKHRDPSETAPCEFTVMENGILIDVKDFDNRQFFRYDEFTHVYTDINGFYMMFKKSKLLVMIRKADVPADSLEDVDNLIITGVSPSCRISRFL